MVSCTIPVTNRTILGTIMAAVAAWDHLNQDLNPDPGLQLAQLAH